MTLMAIGSCVLLFSLLLFVYYVFSVTIQKTGDDGVVRSFSHMHWEKLERSRAENGR